MNHQEIWRKNLLADLIFGLGCLCPASWEPQMKYKDENVREKSRDDLTFGGGHTMQYTDYVSEIYTWNLNSLIYQCQPNTFYKNKNIIYNSIDLFMH